MLPDFIASFSLQNLRPEGKLGRWCTEAWALSSFGHIAVFIISIFSFPSFEKLKIDIIPAVSVDIMGVESLRFAGMAAELPSQRPVIPSRKIVKRSILPVIPEVRPHVKGFHRPVLPAPLPVSSVGPRKISSGISVALPVPEAAGRKAEMPDQRRRARPKDKVDQEYVDQVPALLDKRPASPSLRPSPSSLPEERAQPETSVPSKSAPSLTQSELSSLYQQIKRCWNLPVGVRSAENLSVKFRVTLSPNGNISVAPKLLTKGTGAAFLAAVDSARRALYRCAPYRLPPRKYEIWRDLIVNFDPRKILGF
ncbi:MAG: cell envelope integrity protein TolA [Alphaproteobacteria bacterium]|nr:cell envelope integrity protein TolA [Alphaproteobacteria bacterium]